MNAPTSSALFLNAFLARVTTRIYTSPIPSRQYHTSRAQLQPRATRILRSQLQMSIAQDPKAFVVIGFASPCSFCIVPVKAARRPILSAAG